MEANSSLGRLTISLNPESGSVSYSHESDGKVLTKSDPRVTTCRAYFTSRTFNQGSIALLHRRPRFVPPMCAVEKTARPAGIQADELRLLRQQWAVLAEMHAYLVKDERRRAVQEAPLAKPLVMHRSLLNLIDDY